MTSPPDQNETIGKYLNGLISVEVSRSSDDLDDVLAIEKECWPLSPEFYTPDSKPEHVWQAHRDKFVIRQGIGALVVARYQGTLPILGIGNGEVPVRNGELMATVTAYRCTWAHADRIRDIQERSMRWDDIVAAHGVPPDFYSATHDGWLVREGGVYRPDADVIHLIAANVPPRFRGVLKYADGVSSVVDAVIAGLKDMARQRDVKFVIGVTTLPSYHEFRDTLSPDAYVTGRRTGRLIDHNLRRYERDGAAIICAAPNYMPCDVRSCGHGAFVVYRVT